MLCYPLKEAYRVPVVIVIVAECQREDVRHFEMIVRRKDCSYEVGSCVARMVPVGRVARDTAFVAIPN